MHLFLFGQLSQSVCLFCQSVCPSFCLSVRPSVIQFMRELNIVDFCRKHYFLMQKDDPSNDGKLWLFTDCIDELYKVQSVGLNITVQSLSLNTLLLSLSPYCRLTRLQDLLQKQFFACLSRIVVKKLLVR